jgi:hypothetical protein
MSQSRKKRRRLAMSLQKRKQIQDESIVRVKSIGFGDPVTNICAGESNPIRHCLFVAYEPKSRRNGYGIVHTDHYARRTDGKGEFWSVGVEVLYPGHLDAEKCRELFAPVWDAEYGQEINHVTER